jgi:hypothetical protein
MKMILIIALFLIVVPYAINSQISIKGRVLNSESKKGIEYASVYKEGTNIGCMCDSEGNFVLNNLKEIPDSLIISCVGYESKKVYKSYLETSSDINILLDLKLIKLNEIVIVNDKLKKKTEVYGSNNRNWSNNSPLYFASQHVRYFKINRFPACLDNFSFYISEINGEEKARIRIYTVDSIKQTPNSDLLNSNLIVEKIKKRWNSVDLSKYNILIPKEGFFIGLESIVIDKDSFEKVGENRYTTKYHDFHIGCVKERTITARKHLKIGEYEKYGEMRIPDSLNDWRLDTPRRGFDLFYKVEVIFYE